MRAFLSHYKDGYGLPHDMNSNLLAENVAVFFNALSQEEKDKFLRYVCEYESANQSGNSQRVRKLYSTFLPFVKHCEEKYDICVLSSPDGSYMIAMNTLTNVVSKSLNKVKTVTFNTVEQANTWLKKQRKICVVDFSVETSSRYGRFANHAEASSITIQYKMDFSSIQYQYGMLEDENLSVFKRSKIQNYCDMWEANNPGYEFVYARKITHTRGDHLSDKFGWGANFAENVKHFVIFRRPLQKEMNGTHTLEHIAEPVGIGRENKAARAITAFFAILAALLILMIVIALLSNLSESNGSQGVTEHVHFESSQRSSEDQNTENEYPDSVTAADSNTTEADILPDYDSLIVSFVPNKWNCFELAIGESHSPIASIWSQGGSGITVYSSNEEAVTVSDSGTVTAVGEGSSYVILSDASGMLSQTYLYLVFDPLQTPEQMELPEIPGVDFAYEIENFASSQLNTAFLVQGEKVQVPSYIWAQNGGSCYTSDETVLSVAANGVVTANSPGTAYVVVRASTGMYQVYKYIVL